MTAVLVTAALLAFGAASPAVATIPTRVTAGEAHAAFQAQWTGGVAISLNPAEPEAAPTSDELVPVIMSPISSGPDDPFCVLDWHVIRVQVGLPSAEDLVATDVHIWLDGAQLDLVKTAIKPFTHFPGFYGRAYGLVVPPGTPSAGAHTLSTRLDLFDGTSLEFTTTITVNPADSPACTGS